MKIEIEGKEVEIDDGIAMEALKSADVYNAELDRMRQKGESSARENADKSHSEQIEKMKQEHEQAIKAAQAMASGKTSDQVQSLIDANKTLAENFENLKTDLSQEKEKSVKSTLSASLASSMTNVKDDLVRNTLIENGMKNAVIGDDGQAYFKLSNGTIGDSKAMAEEFAGTYPHHFSSDQPAGTGIVGNSVSSLKPNATLEQKLRAKIKDTLNV